VICSSVPISDCQDNVVDSSFLDDVVHFGLGVSGHVFPVDLKDLLKKILLKIVKSRNKNNNMPEY
jgi:hypothetical protein